MRRQLSYIEAYFELGKVNRFLEQYPIEPGWVRSTRLDSNNFLVMSYEHREFGGGGMIKDTRAGAIAMGANMIEGLMGMSEVKKNADERN